MRSRDAPRTRIVATLRSPDPYRYQECPICPLPFVTRGFQVAVLARGSRGLRGLQGNRRKAGAPRWQAYQRATGLVQRRSVGGYERNAPAATAESNALSGTIRAL
jgi:hypothetical protein